MDHELLPDLATEAKLSRWPIDRSAAVDYARVLGTAGGVQAEVCDVREIEIPGITLGEFVGSGANASVYSARFSDGDGDLVAVKVMHVGLEGGERRFDRERRAMERLATVESVAPVLLSGLLEDGRPYLVMPLYEASLQDTIKSDGPLEPESAAEIVSTIALAVGEGHEQGVLHLDLKPSNILLDSSGAAFIADFGIAELTDASTSLSGAMLTPHYAAPERFQDVKPDSAADVYALGATLYALMAGHPPFATDENGAPAAVMMRILSGEIEMDDLPSSTSPALRSVISLAMHTDPEARPSAKDLSALISKALDEPETMLDAPRHDDSETKSWNRVSDRATVNRGSAKGDRRRRPVALALTTGVLFIVGAIWISGDRSPVESEVLTSTETSSSADSELPVGTTSDAPQDIADPEATSTTASSAELVESSSSTVAPEPGETDTALETSAGGTEPDPVEVPTTTTAAPTTTTTTTVATTSTTVTVPVLDVPVGLAESAQGNRNGRQFVTVVWNQPDGGVFVQVERDGQIVRQADDNGVYSDEGSFAVGQAVVYRIRAVSGDVTSAWSSPVTITFSCEADRCPEA